MDTTKRVVVKAMKSDRFFESFDEVLERLLSPRTGHYIAERRVGPFIITIGEFTPDTHFGRVTFAWSSVECIVSGMLVEETPEGVRTLRPGDVYSYPRCGTRLKLDQRGPIVIFNVRMMSADLEASDAIRNQVVNRAAEGARVWRMFREFAGEERDDSMLQLESSAYALAREGGADRSRHAPAYCRRIADWLAEAESPPSLRALAERVGLHPSHLARAFRAAYGCTVGECYRGQRMLRAVRSLVGTDAGVARIAHHAGFSDHAHFTRDFRRLFGVPPTTMRSEVRRIERMRRFG